MNRNVTKFTKYVCLFGLVATTESNYNNNNIDGDRRKRSLEKRTPKKK